MARSAEFFSSLPLGSTEANFQFGEKYFRRKILAHAGTTFIVVAIETAADAAAALALEASVWIRLSFYFPFRLDFGFLIFYRLFVRSNTKM